MTLQEAVQIVLDIARAELGYLEKASNYDLDNKSGNPGGGNFTKYARDLDRAEGFYNGKKNGYEWCDMFNDWVQYAAWGAELAMRVLCQPSRSAGAGCAYSAGYYKAAGRFFTGRPQPGDQIFFYSGGDINHTGIVEDVVGNTVVTIEGNSDNRVARRQYDLNNPYIAGYGRPRYELITGRPEDYPRSVPASTGTPTGSYDTSSSIQNTSFIQFGDSGVAVSTLQKNLMALGYDLGVWGADGDFGEDTLKAVKKFQSDNNLEVDGVVGSETVRAMESAIKNKQGQEQSGNNNSQGSVQDSQNQIQDSQNEKNVVIEQKESAQAKTVQIGDTVMFNGKKHYRTAFSKTGLNCKPGKAKVTGICVANNATHIYHLVRIIGAGSTVFGWVDASDVEVI